MSHLPVESHCLSAKDALSRGGLDATCVLAHREDVQYRLLVEFTHLLGPDAVIDGEAIRKIVTRLLADYLTHARKLVHRPSRAEFDSASTALAPKSVQFSKAKHNALRHIHATPGRADLSCSRMPVGLDVHLDLDLGSPS